ncbi:VWA domain-containing protein [bacterium]|nr:VWA domain-containing protein [bacterium]
MSFLSLAFLAALPLAAAPILLHLFDRRRHVVIEWGAMQFLLEAATRRTSARRLKQWLLLLLRVLAIAALIFALAQPLLPGNWLGSTDRGETIIVLDNSLSMQRKADGTSLFELAIERAIETVGDVQPGDSVRVLLSSPYPVWALGGSIRVDSASRPVIEDQLQELRPTTGRSDLLSSLFEAVQAEIEPTQRRRRILLLTDGQGSDWSIPDEGGWQRFREVLTAAAVPTQLDIVELGRGNRQSGNVAVNSVTASRTVVGVNQTFSLTAQVQNYGRSTTPSGSVTWLVDGVDEYDSQVPSLDGGQVHDVVWHHSFGETGIFALKCRVDANDELTPDNEETVVVEVVDEVPVLVLETAPELSELQRDAFFVQAALGRLGDDATAGQGVFVPQLVDEQRLDRLHLDDYRAVVIPNLTVLKPDLVAKLQEFVSAGGGLWIALGPRTDVEAFNQHFFADSGGLSPLALDGIADEAAQQTTESGHSVQTLIDAQVNEHPAIAALADSERLDTGDVVVEQRFRFVPPPEGEGASVLLGLSNGEILAAEKYVGRGRVIVQGIPLRLQWSDLARSQAFVVMIQDWLAYLTQPRATRHNLSPGDPITLHIADAGNRDATLHTPHGDEIELTADAAGDGFVFRSSRTVLPGDYVLELGTLGDRVPFHVSRDPQESNLASLTTADHEVLADLSGLSRTTAEASISGTSFDNPLWPLLFMTLIGMIVAELLLSGMIARERFGSDPIAETTEQFGEISSMSLPPVGAPLVSAESKPAATRRSDFAGVGK